MSQRSLCVAFVLPLAQPESLELFNRRGYRSLCYTVVTIVMFHELQRYF